MVVKVNKLVYMGFCFETRFRCVVVNRVILSAILLSEVKKREEKTGAYVKLRIIRYGTSYCDVTGNVWGKAIDWFIKKGFKAGDGVQIIGSLGSRDGGVTLNIDSMTDVPWLTEAHKKSPWKIDDKKS